MYCSNGVCGKCGGVKKVVFAGLLLLNAFVWPMWLGIDGWVAWVAVLWVLMGLVKMFKPSCGHCDVPMAASTKKAKRK